MPPQDRLCSRRNLPLVGLALALAGLAAAATQDAWRDILHIALRDEEASQVLLVPLVAGWLFWVRRHRLRYCRVRGNVVGPLLIGVGWLCHSLGDTHLLQALWHAGAILIAIGCLVAVLGTDLLLQFFPAFLALFFLVPIPGRLRQHVAIPMETVTAIITQHLFELLGAPVGRSGNLLSINGQAVAIAEACNGLRMVATLALVSYTFAFGTPLRWYARAAVLAATPISAIACNVVRLVPTVWLHGHYPGPVAEAFHTLSGWMMLVASFLALMAIIRLLRWALVPVTRYTLAYD